MSIQSTEYEIVYQNNDEGKLVPCLANGTTPKSLVIQNEGSFQERMCDGARFAGRLVELTGPAGRPIHMVVYLLRQVLTIDTAKLVEDFWIRSTTLRLIEADIHYGRAIRLVGPKGTGKTTFVKLLAQHFGVPYLKVDGTGVSKPQDLFGSSGMVDGQLSWVESDLACFIKEHRERKGWPKAFVLLDEFSRMGHSMAPFHALFDQTGSFSFTTVKGTVTITDLQGIIFVLADNQVGPGYIGNQSIDIAMKDRLQIYELSYAPTSWEVNWLTRQTGISQLEAQKIVQIANMVRDLAVEHAWTEGGPSLRRTLTIAQDLKLGLPIGLLIKNRIFDWYPDGDATSERAVIYAALRGQDLLSDVEYVDDDEPLVSMHDLAAVGG